MQAAAKSMLAIATIVGAGSSSASAGFTYFTQFTAWQQAAGPMTTIDFVQPVTSTITDDYSSLGVLFTEGNDVAGPMLQTPTGDGWGLYGGSGNTITIQFTQPVFALAFHKPGSFQYNVYAGDTLLVTDSAVAPFRGITSTIAFDRIVCYDGSTIDNLYFGPPIPAPGAAALLGVSILRSRGRRR